MTNKNQLVFPIPKSPATTSTTNTNLTISSSFARDNDETRQPLLQELLLQGGNSLEARGPFSSTSTFTTANNIQGDILLNTEPSRRDSCRNTKADLIELFDKYDLSNKQSPETPTEKQTFDTSEMEEERDINFKESDENMTSVAKENVDSNLRAISKVSDESEKDHSYKARDTQNEIDSLHEVDNYQNPNEAPSLSIGASFSTDNDFEEKSENTQSGSKIQDNPTDNTFNRAKAEDLHFGDITEDIASEDGNPEEYELKEETQGTSGVSNKGLDNKTLESTSQELRPEHFRSRGSQIKINPKEQYQRSHRPFDFQHFLGELRQKSAEPIVRFTRSFLISFTKQGHTFTTAQKIKIIKDFKAFMNEKFAIYEPFASMDEIDLENSREGLEKLIMNRIYDNSFPPEIAQNSTYVLKCVQDDLDEDEKFSEKAEKYQWIEGKHLDVDFNEVCSNTKPNFDFIEYASNEIRKVNDYKAPRDKIICILNCCKIIFSFLRAGKQEGNADSFIPLLILVIIHANVRHLISNLHYIQNYRGDEWLFHGETSYYLSSLEAAINFIADLDIDNLTISKEEYQQHMKEWKARASKSENVNLTSNPPSLSQPIPHHISRVDSQYNLSPTKMLTSGAEFLHKSLSSFLSPSPSESSPNNEGINDVIEPERAERTSPSPDSKKIKDTYKNMKEMFPNLDKDILKDVVYLKKGDVESSLEACLLLVNES